jgi:hypothetical protein
VGKAVLTVLSFFHFARAEATLLHPYKRQANPRHHNTAWAMKCGIKPRRQVVPSLEESDFSKKTHADSMPLHTATAEVDREEVPIFCLNGTL